ncbi:uncharacterized protein LOC144439383 [Glandiceps talaboti]
MNIDGLRQSFDYSNEDATERRLHESQATVAQLQERVKDSTEICEQQRRHFRHAIEELQTKLNETVIGRDSVLDLRRKEAIDQERLIHQLQNALREIESNNKEQEEALVDMNSRLELMQQKLDTSNSAMNQIKAIIVSEEEKRGRNGSLNTDSMVEQSPAVLSHLLQRCLQDYENELKITKYKLQQTETDLEEMRLTGDKKHKHTKEDYQQRIQQLSDEHEKQIETLTDRASNARKQASSLQSQLNLLQEQTDKQVEIKEKHIKDLEAKVSTARQEFDELKRNGEDKKHTLEYTVEDTKSELSAMRNERDRLLTTVKDLEAEHQEVKQKLSKCQAELDAEKEQNKKLWSREEGSTQKLSELQYDRDTKTAEIERLQKMVETVKSESSTQLHDTIERIEKEEKSRAAERIEELNSQLNSLNLKFDKTVLELELKKSEFENLKKQKEDLSNIHEETKNQLHSLKGEKTNVSSMLEGKSQDVEKLKGERDHYFSLLEERNGELAEMRALKEKLSIQLHECEKNLETWKEQSSNMTQMVEITNKTSHDYKIEKDKLETLLNVKVSELEEVKKSREDTSKKLKIREKRLHALEEEKGTVSHDLGEKTKELAEMTGQKDEIMSELKGSRYQVASLTKENDELKETVERLENTSEKQKKKLLSKLHSLESDLNMAHTALQAQDSVDDKAVKVAESMQREVTAKRGEIDKLQSKLHWLEERLDAAIKENTTLKEEREKIIFKLNRVSSQNEKSESEVQGFVDQNKEQKKLITKLEAALEKAAVKHAAAQALVEQQEQDIARLRLKHQLELKETQRVNIAKTISTSIVLPTTKSPNKSTTETVRSTKATQNQQQQQLQQNLEQQHSDRPESDSTPNPALYTEMPATSTTTQSTQMTQTSNIGQEQSRPTDDHLQKLAVFSEVGQDLKRLLHEMRTLILQGQQQPSPAAIGPTTALRLPATPPTKLTRDNQHKSNSPKSQSTEQDSFTDAEAEQSMIQSSVTMPTYYSNTGYTSYAPSTYTGTMYSQPTYTMSSNFSSNVGGYDSSIYSYSPLKRPTNPAYHRQPASVTFTSPNISTRATSPISDLLTSVSLSPERMINKHNDVTESSSCDDENRLSSDPSTVTLSDHVPTKSNKSKTTKKVKGKSSANKDTADDCIKRLELKMKNLSRLGGQLQRENKAVEAMIKSQDSKLKKCRQKEISVQQLLTSKKR